MGNNNKLLKKRKQIDEHHQLVVRKQKEIQKNKKEYGQRILSNDYLSVLRNCTNMNGYTVNSHKNAKLYKITERLCNLKWIYAFKSDKNFNVSFKMTKLGNLLLEDIKPKSYISTDNLNVGIVLTGGAIAISILLLGLFDMSINPLFIVLSPFIVLILTTLINEHIEQKHYIIHSKQTLSLRNIDNVLIKKLTNSEYRYEQILLKKYTSKISN